MSKTKIFIASALRQNGDRRPVLLALAFVLGSAAYFRPAVEPRLSWYLLAVWASFLALKTRAGLFALMFCAGFGLAMGRAHLAAAPVLTERVDKTWLEAEIDEARPVPGGWRLIVRPTYIKALRGRPRPRRLRLNVGRATLSPGDRIALFATLSPPAVPAIPNGYDPRVGDWLHGIGGSGRGLSRPKILPRGRSGARESIRNFLTDSLSGSERDIALALVLGEQSAVRAATNRAWRDAGIAHMLSVSGLHMMMLAGFVFAAVRFALAFVPRLEGRDTKKAAAGVSLAVLTLYLMVSGQAVPAIRAYVMAAIGLAALLADRRPFSHRTLAAAAVVVTLIDPAAPLSVSFQLSFAAVLALIACFETFDFMRWGRWRGYFLSLCATDAATLAGTLPFTIAVFGRVNLWGIISNLAASPVLGIAVMPALLAGVLFRLEFPMFVAGRGIALIDRIAAGVSSFPAAVLYVRALPVWGFGLAVAGFLWFCLWKGSLRWLGAPLFVLGCVSAAFVRPPDLYLSQRLQAVRNADGSLSFSDSRKERRLRRAWLAHSGNPPFKKSGVPFDADRIPSVKASGPSLVWLDPLRVESDNCRRIWCHRE